MDVKELFKDHSLKKAALLLAERCLQLGEPPVVFKNHDLKALYDYYIFKLGRPLPKPGEMVLYYDPLEDHQPKQTKVVESLDSATLDRPKRIRCEYEGQVFELKDQHIYLLLYW